MLGGRGGVHDDKNGDPGLPGVRQDSIRADSRALVEKNLNVATIFGMFALRARDGLVASFHHHNSE